MPDSKIRTAAMPTHSAQDRAAETTTAQGASRRPYVAPRIVSREPLEAAANICNPAFGGKGDISICFGGTLNS